VCKDEFRELPRNFAEKNKFREKDEITRMFVCVHVKTNFAKYHEISQKINKFREKDETSRMFVCVV
jgi:hypothetical protein